MQADHFTLSMPRIRRERDAAAAIIRALRPLSPRMRAAVLALVAAMIEDGRSLTLVGTGLEEGLRETRRQAKRA